MSTQLLTGGEGNSAAGAATAIGGPGGSTAGAGAGPGGGVVFGSRIGGKGGFHSFRRWLEVWLKVRGWC